MKKYKFTREFQLAMLKALNLEGRPIRRLILTMEVDQPVTLQIDEYAQFATTDPSDPNLPQEYLIANLFELASFEQPTPTPTPTQQTEESI